MQGRSWVQLLSGSFNNIFVACLRQLKNDFIYMQINVPLFYVQHNDQGRSIFGYFFFSTQAADGSIKTLRQVLYDMRRGDVLEILDGRKSPLTHDSGFDSGLGSQSLSASRSEGKALFFLSCGMI